MGEVVMISEDGLELQVQETRVGREMAKLGGGSGGSAAAAEGGSAVVRWDKFLPKMAVRVLLVEADDSTRQIISALLRKCCYKVAAVGDGLKAWELLKGRPNSIDLILTEAELPSISGFALLSLIMEHQACKNIPVIMMSWQDSISTVYKCMLRGATDFLVKPVRKNELRNLWQHVWRKQVSSIAAGLGPPDESVVQEKDDASNRSSGYMSCMDGRKEGGEKGSDAQSSCTKPESDTDEEQGVEYVRGPSKPGSGECISDGISTPGQEECRPLNNATGGSQEMTTLDAVILEDTRDDNEEENSLREAIDLIGAFDNHLKEGTIGTPPAIFSSKFDSLPMLDLSLRRYQADERPGLNHSDASAFSRYINKPLQPSSSTSPSPRNQYSNSEKQPLSCSQNKNLSHPTPLRGIGFGNLDGPYGFVMPSTYCEKSGSPPLPSPDTTHPSESFQPSNLLSSHQSHSHVDNTKSNSDDQLENKPDGKTEEMEDQGLVSPTNQTDSHRAMQREAALTKFRLKRKDRCFDKKVRYESRKKLAEQRPRMKGQFVRQVPSHPQHG